jgi:hypothetical protein
MFNENLLRQLFQQSTKTSFPKMLRISDVKMYLANEGNNFNASVAWLKWVVWELQFYPFVGMLFGCVGSIVQERGLRNPHHIGNI